MIKHSLPNWFMPGLFLLAASLPARAATEAVQHLNPPELPRCGYCSQLVVAPANGRFVHIAGQPSVGMDFHVNGASLAEQLPMAFDALDKALKAGGSDRRHILDLIVYFVAGDGHEADLIVPKLKAYFAGADLPAISIVGTPALVAPGMLIEIEGDAMAAAP
jgi:enamine deaminase RidA (YjgF/YER057c/UK114 family)